MSVGGDDAMMCQQFLMIPAMVVVVRQVLKLASTVQLSTRRIIQLALLFSSRMQYELQECTLWLVDFSMGYLRQLLCCWLQTPQFNGGNKR